MKSPLTLQNIYLRQRGKEHARKHYGRYLLMSLLVYVIVLALEKALTLLGDALMARESAAFAAALSQYNARETLRTTNALREALAALLLSPKLLLYNLVYIAVVALVSNGLNLGFTDQLLQSGKGGQPRVKGLFSRMKQCFKALRLNLWIYLKLFLWALPGVGAMALALLIAVLGYGESGTLLLLGSWALIIVLPIIASMRYALGMYVLAENPNMGVIDCVNESKFLMKGHKGQLFRLGMPCIFIMCALFMATCVAGGMTLGVLEVMGLPISDLALDVLSYLGILVVMLFAPRLNMTYALFYLLRSEMAHECPLRWTIPDTSSLATIPESSAEYVPETTYEKENTDEEPLC